MGWPGPDSMSLNIPVRKQIPCHVSESLNNGSHPMSTSVWIHCNLFLMWLPIMPMLGSDTVRIGMLSIKTGFACMPIQVIQNNH